MYENKKAVLSQANRVMSLVLALSNFTRNFGMIPLDEIGDPFLPDSEILGSDPPKSEDFLVISLYFQKKSEIYDHGTPTSQTDSQTTYHTTLCMASCGIKIIAFNMNFHRRRISVFKKKFH